MRHRSLRNLKCARQRNGGLSILYANEMVQNTELRENETRWQTGLEDRAGQLLYYGDFVEKPEIGTKHAINHSGFLSPAASADWA